MDEELRTMLAAVDSDTGEKAVRVAFQIAIPLATSHAGERPFLEFLMELIKLLLPILIELFKP